MYTLNKIKLNKLGIPHYGKKSDDSIKQSNDATLSQLHVPIVRNNKYAHMWVKANLKWRNIFQNWYKNYKIVQFWLPYIALKQRSDKRKTHLTFYSTGKTGGKMKCPTRLCFCPTINWRCRTKLLIVSNKYLLNKSFLINKLRYPKYCFLQKHLYRKTLQKYNSKSFVLTSSSANKKKILNTK